MRTIIIGRNPNSDVVVNDSKVADSHLQIMQDDLGNFYIKDLGSETGTFVNNEQITGETPLNPTDVVRVGKVTIPWRNYFAATMPAATTINVINQPVRKVVIDTRASAAWGVLSFILSFFSWLFFPAVLSVTFGLIAILVIVLVLVIDQVTKIIVKTTMPLGEMIDITGWFKIHFVENPGMAFGMTIGGESGGSAGKLFLSLFRIVAIGFIIYYLVGLVKKGYAKGYIVCIALILAGAFGNIIDSVFYGEIFSSSYGQAASFVPIGEGYSSWLHGRVVDMLHFPLIEGTFPSWVPIWGGENFTFFSPIFNIADSAITVGIFILLIFYRKTLAASLEKEEKKDKA